MLGVKEVDGVRGGGGGLGRIRRQGGWLGRQVGFPGVAEGEREGRRGPPRGVGGAARQEPPEGSFEVSHEEWVDDGVHGAVAVAQPGHGLKEGRGHTLGTYRLRREMRGVSVMRLSPSASHQKVIAVYGSSDVTRVLHL